MWISILWTYWISVWCALCYAQQDPEVDIKYGRVRGQTVYLSSGLGINTFLSVPYAKAPLGDLRFEVRYLTNNDYLHICCLVYTLTGIFNWKLLVCKYHYKLFDEAH